MIRSYKIHVANQWSAKSFFRTFLAMPWLCQSEFFIQPWQHCSLVNSDSPFWRVQRAQSNTIQISHEVLSYILSNSCFAFFEHSYILIHIIHTIYMCALYTCFLCMYDCTLNLLYQWNLVHYSFTMVYPSKVCTQPNILLVTGMCRGTLVKTQIGELQCIPHFQMVERQGLTCVDLFSLFRVQNKRLHVHYNSTSGCSSIYKWICDMWP